jgi:hypothetical protein
MAGMPATAASLVYPSIQHRASIDASFVIAGQNGSGPTTSDIRTGMGPAFDERLESVLTDVYEPPMEAPSYATALTVAEQTSTLSAPAIVSSGLASSLVEVSGPDGGVARSQGRAELRTLFSVDAPTGFSFGGDVSCFIQGGTCDAFVTLTAPGGLVLADWRTTNGSDGGNVTGTLLPGVNYDLWARVGSFAGVTTVGSQGGFGLYQLNLELIPVPEIPEPATLALWGLGLAAVGAAARRRRRG